MAEIAGEIVISRPVEEVFDFVADERNEPKYNPEMRRPFKITSGPIGTGTRFTAMHMSGGRTDVMTIEVTQYDRPHRLASRTVMSWAEIRGALTFDAAGAGTRMRWAWTVRPKGARRVMAPIVGIVGRRQEQAVWEGLKHYLENR